MAMEPDPFASSYSKFVNQDSFVICLASLYVAFMGSALYSRRALCDWFFCQATVH